MSLVWETKALGATFGLSSPCWDSQSRMKKHFLILSFSWSFQSFPSFFLLLLQSSISLSWHFLSVLLFWDCVWNISLCPRRKSFILSLCLPIFNLQMSLLCRFLSLSTWQLWFFFLNFLSFSFQICFFSFPKTVSIEAAGTWAEKNVLESVT